MAQRCGELQAKGDQATRLPSSGVEADPVGQAGEIAMAGGGVAVDHDPGQPVVRALEKGLADPDRTLADLMLKGNAGAHTGMHKEVLTADG